MRKPMILPVLTVLFLCPLACLTDCPSSPARFEATRAVPLPAGVSAAAAPVFVESRNGSITLLRGATPSLTARLGCTTQERLDATQIVAERQPADGSLRVFVAWAGGRPEDGEGCSFELTLPATSAVTLRTSNGPLEVAGLAGPADLHTSNAPVTVARHAGDVRVQTSNGSVTLTAVTGSARANTSNASVRITDVAGPATVHTSNGSVDLTLPPTFAGTLSLSTSNGSIHCPTGAPVTASAIGKNSGRLTLNQGSTPSDVSTSNASISVKVR
jgi:hypothetical protein